MTNRSTDFLIVTALEEERDALLDRLPGYQQLNPSEVDIRTYYLSNLRVTFPNGSTGSYQVVVMSLLGMGRVQATTATGDAIRRWQPRYVILVGIAGGILAKKVALGDILVAEQVVDYELQKLTTQGPQVRWRVHPSDARLLGAVRNFNNKSWPELINVKRPSRGRPKRHIGSIASGDKVIAFSEVLAHYRSSWPELIGVEMEAAGVATASFQAPNPPGFFMVRSVSDLADENKGSPGVEKWRTYACEAAAAYLITLLKSGPVPSEPSGIFREATTRDEEDPDKITLNSKTNVDVIQVQFPNAITCRVSPQHRKVQIGRVELQNVGKKRIPAGWRGKISLLRPIDFRVTLVDTIVLPSIPPAIPVPIGPFSIDIPRDIVQSKDEWHLELYILDPEGNQKLLFRSSTISFT